MKVLPGDENSDPQGEGTINAAAAEISQRPSRVHRANLGPDSGSVHGEIEDGRAGGCLRSLSARTAPKMR